LIKSELHGKSDSLVYINSDSTIHLYKDPIVWENKNQITADSISFLIVNEEIDKVFLIQNAFTVNRDTIGNFNQMKGRRMTGYFKDQKISRLHIQGNGESIYFDLVGDTLLRGMNKMLCANIMMFFEEGNIKKINWLVKPEGNFKPPHMIEEKDKELVGFRWREEEKPSMKAINEWRMPKKREKNRFNFFNQPDAVILAPSDEEIQKLLEEKLKSGN
jgi:hypothetical protein